MNFRHKELLERQHFGGPYWEEKEKPISITKKMPEYIPEKTEIPDIPEEVGKVFEELPEYWEDTFQKINR